MNTHPNWQLLLELNNSVQAELLRGLLEAAGIPVRLSQEGAGRAIGLTVGSMGAIEVLVPDNYIAEASAVLDAYYAGEFADSDEEY